MSTDRWMDEEIVVYIHNGILLSHEKEHIWVSSNEVDEPRAYYTEWSKSEEKDKCSILTHIYMESRKVVLMNLSVRQWGRWRHWKWTCEHGAGGWVGMGGKNWKNSTET